MLFKKKDNDKTEQLRVDGNGPVDASRVCSSCGAYVPPGSMFCPKCFAEYVEVKAPEHKVDFPKEKTDSFDFAEEKINDDNIQQETKIVTGKAAPIEPVEIADEISDNSEVIPKNVVTNIEMDSSICPSCGAKCDVSASICPNCNYNFNVVPGEFEDLSSNFENTSNIVCSNCNAKFPSSYTQCPNCRADVYTSQQDVFERSENVADAAPNFDFAAGPEFVSNSTQVDTKHQLASSKKISKIAIVIVIVACLIVALVFCAIHFDWLGLNGGNHNDYDSSTTSTTTVTTTTTTSTTTEPTTEPTTEAGDVESMLVVGEKKNVAATVKHNETFVVSFTPQKNGYYYIQIPVQDKNDIQFEVYDSNDGTKIGEAEFHKETGVVEKIYYDMFYVGKTYDIKVTTTKESYDLSISFTDRSNDKHRNIKLNEKLKMTDDYTYLRHHKATKTGRYTLEISSAGNVGDVTVYDGSWNPISLSKNNSGGSAYIDFYLEAGNTYHMVFSPDGNITAKLSLN